MIKKIVKPEKECIASRIKKTLPKKKIVFKKPAKKPVIKQVA
jgi:hypothetical protein